MAIDPEIVDYADANDLVIITVDTDFPMLLALRRTTSPIGRTAARRQ